MGDPVLHSVATEVTEVTDEVRGLVADMYETMDLAPGVGLAAPQVGVSLRIFVYSYVDDDQQPWRGEIINPVLWMTPPEPGSPDEDDESEGCLSFPGERFPLRRSERVVVTGTDLTGASVHIEVDGWRARIMQHEFDHLDGILYIDRLSDSDWKTAQKIARKRSWTRGDACWMPGVDGFES
ncbi:Peptide deformylase [Microbacterium esteraromaticum]|uniref:Peptide deformylase n=2 Tax=Microbacterium esteraromaticum TaxID=57043 RepID=A0A1R4IYZ6_9MICO|nr:Peptide deformylase [Microbacterium esteraromaticum]